MLNASARPPTHDREGQHDDHEIRRQEAQVPREIEGECTARARLVFLVEHQSHVEAGQAIKADHLRHVPDQRLDPEKRHQGGGAGVASGNGEGESQTVKTHVRSA